MEPTRHHITTRVIHGDAHIDDGAGVAPPIHVATTFDKTRGDEVYRRYDHRTTERLEAVLGDLDGGIAVAYASGLAAVGAVIQAFGPSRIALPADVYHGTRINLEIGASAGRWTLTEAAELSTGDVLWVETPSNPKCLITDVAEAAEQAHAVGARLVVDATFATPVLLQPLELGADAVVHSSTKFLNGHSDAVGGVVVVGDAALADQLRHERGYGGAVMGSLEAWLTLRGLRTLPLRVARQSATAAAIAAHLASRVATVWHPSLPGHPGHDIAATQMQGGGGVLSFEMDSDSEAAAVMERLELFGNATSLGGVESLAEHRRTVDPDAPEGLIRLAIGLEDPADLIADLDQALGEAPVSGSAAGESGPSRRSGSGSR